jgi:phenylpropionate dioxygenase-like ring-hydroxylating dioxygenase large terminal subunit
MLGREQNDLITLTRLGTPGGELMRRYWQPVALSEEVPADAPVPVRVMGEDLVLYRDGEGRPNLIGRRCPHRGVDLSYGRVEGGGLRCLYHGWLLAGNGRCLQQPGEPAGSTFKDKIRHTAYPCREGGGLILAYLGPGEPPRLPQFPFLAGAPERVWCTKIYHACNYLQANEGNIDPQHLSFLHVIPSPQSAILPDLNDLLTGDVAPRLEVEETAFGHRVYTTRKSGPDKHYVRITNFVMPNCSAFDGVPLLNPRTNPFRPNLGYQIHWHVPIDDGEHWKYTIIYRYDGPVDRDYMEKELFAELDESYRSPRNAQNRYLQNRAEMKRETFAGLGRNFYDQDLFAVETQGAIMDRSNEHLGTTDRPVILMRRQLLKAVEDVRAGRDPLFVERDGDANALAELVVRSDTLPAGVDVMSGWWREAARRELAPASR